MLLLLLILVLVRLCAGGAQVVTFTSDIRGAGTDANVHLIMHGTLGDGTRHVLSSGADDFERCVGEKVQQQNHSPSAGSSVLLQPWLEPRLRSQAQPPMLASASARVRKTLPADVGVDTRHAQVTGHNIGYD